jgi:hypothetical protein
LGNDGKISERSRSEDEGRVGDFDHALVQSAAQNFILVGGSRGRQIDRRRDLCPEIDTSEQQSYEKGFHCRLAG